MSTEPRERLPGPGWSPVRGSLPPAISVSAWTNGRLRVISALEMAEAPDGRGDAIPQWHISVTESGLRPSPRGLRRALRAFGMGGAECDNHHPGNAQHYWLPLDKARRVDCQCKADEVVVKEPGYTWTNPAPGEGECRGCEWWNMCGKRCPIHGEKRGSL